MKPSYGVVVGRFQVNFLHDGHKNLFDQVMARHKRVIVFVGTSSCGLTREHPLDFAVREAMIKAAYPKFIVQPLADCRDDNAWSQQLDTQIDHIVDYGEVTLYGGRDSFVPHYTGKYKPVELALDPRKHKISGTDIRREFSDHVIASLDFRAGMIYATHQLWPVMLMMVDIAVLSYDRKELLLGRKPNEDKWRFLGGHAESSKLSLEENARAEAFEEAGCDLIDIEYVGSTVIKDWRYCQVDRSVMTALFMGRISSMGTKAGDDIKEVQWFVIDKLTPQNIVEEHHPLLSMLKLRI